MDYKTALLVLWLYHADTTLAVYLITQWGHSTVIGQFTDEGCSRGDKFSPFNRTLQPGCTNLDDGVMTYFVWEFVQGCNITGFAYSNCEQLGKDGTEDGYEYGGADMCLFSGIPGKAVKSIELYNCPESNADASLEWTEADTIGTTVGTFIAFVTLVGTVFFWYRRRQQKRRQKEKENGNGSDSGVSEQGHSLANVVVQTPGGVQADAERAQPAREQSPGSNQAAASGAQQSAGVMSDAGADAQA